MKNINHFFPALLLLVGNLVFAQTYELPQNVHLPKSFSTEAVQKMDATAGVVRRPQKADYYDHDSLAQDWVLTARYEYDYTNEGWQKEEIMTEPVSGENNQRIRTDYNAAGDVTAQYTDWWDGSGWEPLSRETSQYDASGNRTEFLREIYDAGNWVIIEGEQITFAYDKDSNLISKTTVMFDYVADDWVNYSKENFNLFENGIPTQLITQIWYGAWTNTTMTEVQLDSSFLPAVSTDFDWHDSVWTAVYREYDYVWFDWEEELPLSYKTEYYSDSLHTWVNEYSVTAQYATNGSFTMLYATWNDSTKSYSPYLRVKAVNDHYGNNTELSVEINFGIWFPIIQVITDYVYAANGDMLEMAVSDFDPMQFALVPSYKYVYSSFAEYGQPTGIAAPPAFAKIYPTATTGMLFIKSTGEDAGFYYEVLDISGRRLMAGNGANAIDLSAIPAQPLLLRLTDTQNNTMVERIYKQ